MRAVGSVGKRYDRISTNAIIRIPEKKERDGPAWGLACFRLHLISAISGEIIGRF